ncbi:MAG: 3-deoxy-D-manno-octulosonic acid kinase [Kangiellaceae bacterium]|nr:3-deoxy-D-manno-octulosonic acid kinase [Kangiellaceae bacterium]
MNINIKKESSSLLLSSKTGSSSRTEIRSDWFDISYWQHLNAVVGQSKGRQITWFIHPFDQCKETDWVLRHYYRGGLIAKFSTDKFVYTGIKNSRPYRELALLTKMDELDLPVPKCVGARVIKSGLLYSADLMMEKLIAEDLVSVLKKRMLSKSVWQEIGKVIACFHLQGIYHSDLNAHNIMLDDESNVWLIDFDRCEWRSSDRGNKSGLSWKNKNIERLLRSFNKEKALNSDLYFSLDNWSRLIDGYQNT